MPAPETLIVFLGATLALALTPGPDLLYIATRSASEGRTAGVVSVLGVSLGLVIHTIALALGLSALLTAVPIAYEVVRWVGAAYLIYLGAKLLVRPSHGRVPGNLDSGSVHVGLESTPRCLTSCCS